MSDREAAIAAEIDECDYEEVEVSHMTQWGAPDIVTICAIHGCEWDDDETIPCWERRRMTAALRRMWDAAINAAAGATSPMGNGGGFTSEYDAAFCDGWDQAMRTADREIRALLSEGGDRD